MYPTSDPFPFCKSIAFNFPTLGNRGQGHKFEPGHRDHHNCNADDNDDHRDYADREDDDDKWANFCL